MKVFIKSGIITLGIILVQISLFGQTKDFQKANAAAQLYVQKRTNKGLVVGIIQNGKTKILSYGKLSNTSSQAPDGNTLFEIGAVTSVFTTSLAKLEEKKGLYKMEDFLQDHFQGEIRVPNYRPEICFEEKVQSYPESPMSSGHDFVVCIPAPMSAASCITFCHLASHSAGLPNTPKGVFSWNPIKKNKQKKDPYVHYEKADLYKNLEKVFINYKPGSVFDYSNWGIAILGNLVADISSQPYEALLINGLLNPLKMNDTRTNLTPHQSERLTKGHNRSGKMTDHWHVQSMGPAIGLKSSVNDLLTFIDANLNPPTTDLENAFIEVQQGKIDTYEKKLDRLTSMGYGWFTSTLNEETNLPIQWVNGGTGGFRSFVGFSKDAQTGVVVLSNSVNTVDDLGFLFLEGLIGTEINQKKVENWHVKN